MKKNTTHSRFRLFERFRVYVLGACAGLLLPASVVFAANASKPLAVSAATQEQVVERLQEVFGTYRGEHTLPSESTNNPSATYTNLEAKLREASALMPERMDLRFGIASALLSQALQTNSQFEVKMAEALDVYQEIRKLDTNGFHAQ